MRAQAFANDRLRCSKSGGCKVRQTSKCGRVSGQGAGSAGARRRHSGFCFPQEQGENTTLSWMWKKSPPPEARRHILHRQCPVLEVRLKEWEMGNGKEKRKSWR